MQAVEVRDDGCHRRIGRRERVERAQIVARADEVARSIDEVLGAPFGDA